MTPSASSAPASLPLRASYLAPIAAFIGALAVALGAFGAHGLKAILSPEALAWWRTGAEYQLVHAVAMLAAGLAIHLPSPRPIARPRALAVAGWLFALGVLFFAGSLYLMALTDLRWLGAVTPLGGTAFIAGWLALALGLWPSRPGPSTDL